MAGVLLSGPAGAGKSQEARDLLEAHAGPAAIVDFQSIYAALLLLRRGDDGRYPEREPRHGHILQLAEYMRRAAITGAIAQQVYVIATNSDGDAGRRSQLLRLLGIGARERVIDPGRAVVESRLMVNDKLSVQCGEAIARWYARVS